MGWYPCRCCDSVCSVDEGETLMARYTLESTGNVFTRRFSDKFAKFDSYFPLNLCQDCREGANSNNPDRHNNTDEHQILDLEFSSTSCTSGNPKVAVSYATLPSDLRHYSFTGTIDNPCNFTGNVTYVGDSENVVESIDDNVFVETFATDGAEIVTPLNDSIFPFGISDKKTITHNYDHIEVTIANVANAGCTTCNVYNGTHTVTRPGVNPHGFAKYNLTPTCNPDGDLLVFMQGKQLIQIITPGVGISGIWIGVANDIVEGTEIIMRSSQLENGFHCDFADDAITVKLGPLSAV